MGTVPRCGGGERPGAARVAEAPGRPRRGRSGPVRARRQGCPNPVGRSTAQSVLPASAPARWPGSSLLWSRQPLLAPPVWSPPAPAPSRPTWAASTRRRSGRGRARSRERSERRYHSNELRPSGLRRRRPIRGGSFWPPACGHSGSGARGTSNQRAKRTAPRASLRGAQRRRPASSTPRAPPQGRIREGA